MKSVIITKEQLHHICEEDTVTIAAQAKNNDLSSYTNAASDPGTQNDVQKAKVAGDVNLVISGPKSSDDEPQQTVNVTTGDTLQNAIKTQANDSLIRNGGTVKVTGDGFGESRVYSKKMIEEAAKKKMSENFVVYSKQQLKEEAFRNVHLTEQGIESLIANSLVYKVLEAYEELGDADELGYQRDWLDFIVKKYEAADDDAKARFLARLQ